MQKEGKTLSQKMTFLTFWTDKVYGVVVRVGGIAFYGVPVEGTQDDGIAGTFVGSHAITLEEAAFGRKADITVRVDLLFRAIPVKGVRFDFFTLDMIDDHHIAKSAPGLIVPGGDMFCLF